MHSLKRSPRALGQFLVVAVTGLLLAAVVGCAQLGVPAPQTFNQNLAVAASVNTEVRQTATTLLQAGKLSVADAENIQKQANTAREGLDVARSLSGTDLGGATNKLTAATAILQALQAYLVTKQGASK